MNRASRDLETITKRAVRLIGCQREKAGLTEKVLSSPKFGKNIHLIIQEPKENPKQNKYKEIHNKKHHRQNAEN